MKGHVRQRSPGSWELKFDAGVDPLTGRRVTKYRSVKCATKREAQAELRKALLELDKGTYIDASKTTLGDFLDRWLRDWAAHNVSAKTRERYAGLIATSIKPHLGARNLQKLRPADLASLYTKLVTAGRKGGESGLAPRTVGHVHRILHRALGHAARWGERTDNPASLVEPPRVEQEEIAILGQDDIRTVLAKLRSKPLYMIALVGLSTGMRRGEILALRWRDIDFAAGRIRVEQSLEQTKEGLRFKSPKTKSGRRSITIPASVSTELKAHLRLRQEQFLAIGRGKVPDDGLVFCDENGQPLSPNAVTKAWSASVVSLGLPDVTLHAWRHTHASQLIAAGMDVLTISRRLGHGSPSITLNVYGHLFNSTDDAAARVIENAFGGISGGNS